MLDISGVGPGKPTYERFLPASLWVLLSIFCSLFHNFFSLQAWEEGLSNQVICLPSVWCDEAERNGNHPLILDFQNCFALHHVSCYTSKEAFFFFFFKAENWVKNKKEEKRKDKLWSIKPQLSCLQFVICFMISDTTDCEPAMFGNGRWLNLLARCKCNLCLLLTVWESPSFSKSPAGPGLISVTNIPCLESQPPCTATLFLIYKCTNAIHTTWIFLSYRKEKKCQASY